MSDTPAPRWTRIVPVIALPHLLFLLGWVASTLKTGVMRRDWYGFKKAAERAVAGDLDALYPPFYAADDWRFIYPPYTVLFYLWLAPLSDPVAFALVTAVQVASIAAAVALMVRALPTERAVLAAVLVAFAASAPFAYQVILGQNAGSFLLILVASAALMASGRSFAAGAVLALLAIKPNWVLAPLGLLLVFDRRAFAGMCTMLAALGVASLWGGVELWERFFDLASAQAEHTGDVQGGRHNITLRGSLVGALGADHGTLVNAIWVAAVVPTTAALMWAWSRPLGAWRKMSLLTLFLVSMNLYVNSYDAVVLLFPLLDLLFGPDRVRPSTRTALLALLGVAWATDLVAYMYPVLFGIPYPPFTLSGLVAGVWLVVLCASARQGSA